MQLIISCISSVIYLILYNNNKEYLGYIFHHNNYAGFGSFARRLGTWLLIFNNFVPISLMVTLEGIKYFQGKFISWDYNIYDRSINKVKGQSGRAIVQTSTLNEELGQVKVKIIIKFYLFGYFIS